MTVDGRKLMVVIAIDYESAHTKGVDNLFLEYDEDGFFGKVFLICPYIRRDRCRVLVLNTRYQN